MKKIAIIDFVGAKAGMDYYDESLLTALSGIGYKAFLFSNYVKCVQSVDVVKVFDRNAKNKFSMFGSFFFGLVRSLIICKKKEVRTIILHVFSASNVMLIFFAIVKIFGFKVITIGHDIVSCTGDDSSIAQQLIYNRFSSSIVVHNKYSQGLLSNLVADQSKIKVIQSGNYISDINREIDRDHARRILRLDENYRYILFFGQIKTVKGLDVLIESLPLVDKDIRLIIAGNPNRDDFQRYQDQIDRLDLSERVVKFVRYIKDEEKDLFFAAADALILPYRAIFQSAVLLMGMSYGVPIIASDLAGNREVITDESYGLLFACEDHEDLARKIGLLFSTAGMLENISIRSRAYMAEQYSWENAAVKYTEVL